MTGRSSDAENLGSAFTLTVPSLLIVSISSRIFLLALVSGFSLYSVIWLILAALAVKSAIQTVISIHLRSGAVIRIPYSAQQAVSAEFIDALNTVRQYTA